MSIEMASRSGESSLDPNYSVGALYNELNSFSGFILSLLLDVIQYLRTTYSLSALLRFQGILLFSMSTNGSCPLELYEHSSWLEGNMLCTSENTKPNLRYADMQFWKRASEPILVHDAFSSLMWILFCLPWPILFCKESYTSLVHAFYVVSVTQGIITYLNKRESFDIEMGFGDTLITDIYRLMRGCHDTMKYFESFYIDPAYDVYEAIRSLTFPYLRRCALFWELINCSNKKLFSDSFQSSGEPLYASDCFEHATNTMEELSEIEKLERMFSIPPLNLVVNNEKSRLKASTWLSHFLNVYKGPTAPHILRCTPAVPFKLILLPHHYQDLLRRYIKRCCPDCGVVKEEPALCLLCGKLCSKTCCSDSAHAMVCGAGIGVFLLIRRTTILLQRSARQASWPSPYLDAFGEEDVEMHRGKPLFLNQERYAALTHMFEGASANNTWFFFHFVDMWMHITLLSFNEYSFLVISWKIIQCFHEYVRISGTVCLPDSQYISIKLNPGLGNELLGKAYLSVVVLSSKGRLLLHIKLFTLPLSSWCFHFWMYFCKYLWLKA